MGWWRCNLLDIPTIDLSDAESAVSHLEDAIPAGTLNGYAPTPINLPAEHQRYAAIRASIAA
ncbi:hypothetical protein [uncultured Sphingomonas sp.]|uniref:hypothetical protein n=1 Tax=uncultured Sphingomonas sp. TaxID=158754 RepID=UPI0025F28EE4|nr:hypothetical protein [uncultured Sphingomonas sp.]